MANATPLNAASLAEITLWIGELSTECAGNAKRFLNLVVVMARTTYLKVWKSVFSLGKGSRIPSPMELLRLPIQPGSPGPKHWLQTSHDVRLPPEW